MLRLMITAAVLLAGSTQAQTNPWQVFGEDHSRVKSYLDTSAKAPQVVCVFTEATVGEEFLWTAWAINPTRDSRFYECSNVAYLGVQSGSLILRLRRYSVHLERGDAMRDGLLAALPVLEEASAWPTYGDQATSACGWGTVSVDTTSTVSLPLNDSVAVFSLPETRTWGLLSLAYDSSDSSLQTTFDSWQGIKARRESRKPSRNRSH